MSSLLEVEDVVVEYRGRGVGARTVRAVDGVSLAVGEGETLGLVGESGCGKSTLARAVLRLVDVTSGRVVVAGRDITHLGRRRLRPVRRQMHVVFQDPAGSLNPRMTVGRIVAEPLRIHRTHRGAARDGRVAELLSLVGLDPAHAGRYPHELSGGQQQRVGIARAIAHDPKLVVLDEPVTALDASIRAQVLNLLADLQRRLGLAYLLIAHDISAVSHMSDRVAVMYLGRLVETGPARDVLSAPAHPYTRALLSAVPEPGRSRASRIVLRGEVPDPANPPSGCRFRTRCWMAEERCTREPERLAAVPAPHACACFLSQPERPA